VAYRFDCTDADGRRRGVGQAVTAIGEGALVALPVDTMYGIGCDAFNPGAVEALRALKGHSRSQPPPVMIGHPRTVDGIATGLSATARAMTRHFWPGGLTLICRAQPSLDWDLGDTGGTVTVRVPLHPLALELLERTGPLAVTSAGSAGRPATTAEQVWDSYGDTVGVHLSAGPTEGTGVSTIVDVTGETPRLLREGEVSVAQLRRVAADLVL
jgi:L-threonylcarbamoyladenylate synthase